MIILQSNEINDFPNIWSLAFCMAVIYIYFIYILPYTLFLYGPVLCIAYIFYFQGQGVCAYVYALRILRMHVYAYIYILGSTGSVQILFAYPRLVLTVEVIYCIFSCAYIVNVCILIIYTYLVCNFANMFTFDDVYIHIWYHFVYVIPALILKYMYIRLANFKKSLKDRLR